MELDLTFEQRAILELLAIHAGLSPTQLLLESVRLILARDACDGLNGGSRNQSFLSGPELEARFSRLLDL